jgi:uncharacterized protein (DUF58 family)
MSFSFKTPQKTISLLQDAHALAARLPHLRLEARRVVTALSGHHGRRMAGMGETFWQYRPYVVGESADRIDWRRSARGDQVYVRERERESAHTIWMWVDHSASMLYGSHKKTKLDAALILMFALTSALIEAGERVGYSGIQSPRTHKSTAHVIEEQLAATYQADAQKQLTDFPDLAQFSAGETAAKPQDTLLLFTDALIDLAALETKLKNLAASGMRGYLIRLLDPAEITFPFTGEITLAAMEDERTLDIGDAGAWRTEYVAQFAAHTQAVEKITKQAGFTLFTQVTDHPLTAKAQAILQHLQTDANFKANA